MIRAGQFRDRCDVIELVHGQDAAGVVTSTDQPLAARIPCRVEALSGRAAIELQALAAEVSHRVTIRFRPLPPATRLRVDVLEGPEPATRRRFRVDYVRRPDDRKDAIELLCVEQA